MTTIRCIWCGENDPNPVPEHVFPAALGCPDGFCLINGEVCTSCNNGLGHLDQAVIDDLDILAFISGIPRRDGKPPIISNRRNLLGEVKDGHAAIHLNTGKHAADLGDGRTLPAYRGSDRDIQASFSVDPSSGKATVSFSTSIGTHPKFARGVHKIAFTCMAFHLGYEHCLNQRYDEVRRFVRDQPPGSADGANRKALMLLVNPEPLQFASWVPVGPNNYPREIIPFRLGALDFVVDLSPSQIHLPTLIAQCKTLFGQTGWTLIPPSLVKSSD